MAVCVLCLTFDLIISLYSDASGIRHMCSPESAAHDVNSFASGSSLYSKQRLEQHQRCMSKRTNVYL
jgi:hypothetical protein